MALLAIKKVALTSLLTAGGGYAGAIFLSNYDPELKNSIERHVPGIDLGLDLLRTGARVVERLSSSLSGARQSSPPPRGSPSSAMAQRRELDAIKTPLELDKAAGVELPMVDLASVQRQLDIFKAELETELLSEVSSFIQSEHEKALKHQAAVLGELAEMEAQLSALSVRFRQVRVASDSLVLSQCVNEIAASVSNQQLHTLAKLAQRARVLANDKFVDDLCKVVTDCCQALSQVPTIDPRAISRVLWVDWRGADLLHRFLEGGARSCLFAIIPESLQHLLPLKNDIENRKRVQRACASLASNDLLEAIRDLNQVTGWPRVALKDTIVKLRALAELQQGLGIMTAYLLANSL